MTAEIELKEALTLEKEYAEFQKGVYIDIWPKSKELQFKLHEIYGDDFVKGILDLCKDTLNLPDIDGLYIEKLHIIEEILKAGYIEKYLKLTKELKKHLAFGVERIVRSGMSTGYFFRTIELAGDPELRLIEYGGELKFFESLYGKVNFETEREKVSRDFRNFVGFGLNSKERKEFVEENSIRYNASCYETILFLLRSIYCEEVLIEIIERSHLEDQEVSFDQLLDILKDWGKLRDYPLSWGLALL